MNTSLARIFAAERRARERLGEAEMRVRQIEARAREAAEKAVDSALESRKDLAAQVEEEAKAAAGRSRAELLAELDEKEKGWQSRLDERRGVLVEAIVKAVLGEEQPDREQQG